MLLPHMLGYHFSQFLYVFLVEHLCLHGFCNAQHRAVEQVIHIRSILFDRLSRRGCSLWLLGIVFQLLLGSQIRIVLA
jgi:hypothetical protein